MFKFGSALCIHQIHTLYLFISALSETKRLKEETDQKTRTKGELCSQILGKQRKISSMESDSANLAQVHLTSYVSHEYETSIKGLLMPLEVITLLFALCCLSCVVESGAYPTRTRQYICKACIQTVTQKDLTARSGLWFWNHLPTVNSIVYNCSSNYIKTAEEAKTKLEEQKVFLFASSCCDCV